MACESRLAPVFVLNPYYTGIGIARSLHGSGVRVFALSSERTTPGGRSRFFTGVYHVPNGRDEPEALCQRLLELREHHVEAPVIFPTRDLDVVFLQQHRDRLSPIYRLPRSLDQGLPRLLDKLELSTVASESQIAVPRTLHCCSEKDVDAALTALRLPLIVKPRFSFQWRRGGVDKLIGAQKAFFVESADQLWQAYHRSSLVSGEVLVQEFVPGKDSDIVVCGCYITSAGKLLGHFTARKLCQYPSLFGTGCVVELADIPEIVDPAHRLLKAFRYSGLAEVEFKYDRASDTYFLIEVNPRHWDQHELGVLAGVNLTWVAYQDLVGNPLSPKTATHTGIAGKWIAEREALLLLCQNRLLDILGVLFRQIVSYRRRSTVLAVLDLRDPLPGTLLCFRLLGEFVTSAWRMFQKLAGRPRLN